MKRSNFFKSGLILLVLTLFGCGGGGGGSSVSLQTTEISGVASKAPISGGNVNVFKIVNGTKVVPAIASGTTGTDGTYNLSWESYSGPVLVEISGGSYTDEATGNTNATIPPAEPLHAVVPSASGAVSAAVTPLTDLAFQLAGANLTEATISSANEQVASMFGVDDIIGTQPVAPTASALAASTTAQRAYTLALAAFSQIVKDQSSTVAETITYFKDNTTAGTGLTSAAAAALQNAVATFFTQTNSNNETGVKAVKLFTTGSLPSGNTILGIQAEINLPSGVSVKTDSNGVLAGYLFTSGLATTLSSIKGNVSNNQLTINLVTPSGIGVGEFATLYCDVASNAPSPLGSFTINTGYKIVGYDSSTGSSLQLSEAPYNLNITIQ
jgi:uncharacterized protein (UPF0333 family)